MAPRWGRALEWKRRLYIRPVNSPYLAMKTDPCRLLVVEDSAPPALLLRTHLTHLGYEVLPPVPSAAAALAVFRTADPPVDAAVLDIGLVGSRDGLALAADLQASGPLPIVFITGHDPALLLPLVAGLPAATLLRKPLDLAALADQLALVRAAPAALWLAPAVPPALPRHCFLRRGQHYQRLRLAHIRYAQAEGGCWYLATKAGTFAVALPLHALVQVLAPPRFMLAHRGCLVNVRYVQGFDAARQCITVGDASFALGREYREALLQRFALLG